MLQKISLVVIRGRSITCDRTVIESKSFIIIGSGKAFQHFSGGCLGNPVNSGIFFSDSINEVSGIHGIRTVLCIIGNVISVHQELGIISGLTQKKSHSRKK